MKHALAAALALALAACGSLPMTQMMTAREDATRAFIVAEQGYDTAVVIADGAVKSGALPSAEVGRLKVMVDTGHSYIVAGRTAVTAADATGLAEATAALVALTPQIAALVGK